MSGGAAGWAAFALALAAAGPACLRFLRVAQREHYLAGSATRFAGRWWRAQPIGPPLLAVGLAGVVAAGWWAPAALAAAIAAAAGPPGLSVRGRTGRLAWTRRLRTLAVAAAVPAVVVVVVAAVLGVAAVGAAAVAVGAPLLVDLGCAATDPLERRLAGRHVARAAERLRRAAPTVVAITGSYGKTSTKGYLAHLAGAARAVVATPASFNNRAGLARSVNEQLAPGTEVFIAEMGTYGPGEIAELCRFVPPDVAVITAIGPVHLERFGSEDAILAAKSEILVRASQVVLAVDDPRLAAVAERCQAEGKRVWACSARRPDADVAVVAGADGADVLVAGRTVASGLHLEAQPSNVACAVAAALALGVPAEAVARRLADLPTVAHRLEAARVPGGPLVLDDTYNSNPAGARAALDRLLAAAEAGGRTVVVTPGMVELGARQAEENARFAAAVAAACTDLVVVGRTNRRALVAGAAGGAAAVRTVEDRPEAVAWVRATLGPGDAVLYENDLPDHYP